MKTKVLAIDIGYGNTKFAFRIDRSITTDMFPSLAPFAARRTITGGPGGNFSTRKVVQVQIDGVTYEVGPDVATSAAYGDTGRVLTNDYVETSNYAALLAGAITYSGFDHIERLVLGLPVHTMDKFARHLIERFTGVHDFGQGKVTIERVNVIPQPLGSLTYAKAIRNGVPEKSGARKANLVIDVGYFTIDWIYVTDFVIDDRRSGGRPGGVSMMLQKIAEDVGNDNQEQVNDIERIDECLRHGYKFPFFGKEIDLVPYLPAAQNLIKTVALDVKNKVGAGEGLGSIILSGGGADLYEPIVRTVFPQIPIIVLEQACFANAIGFLLAGETAETVH